MKYSTGLASLLVLMTAESALAQSPPWGQCGGQTWTGATTCTAGWTCVYSNPFYSQCLQGSSTPTSTAQPTTTAKPTTTAQPTTTPPTTMTVAPTTTPPTTTGVPSSCQTPSTISGYSNSALPDPFLSFSGGRITSKADWTCRRAEIAAVVQGYEAGTLPPKPTVSGSISGTTLTVSATFNGKTVSFTNTIVYPSGTMPSGGWPLVIALGGGSIPIPAGIATLNYNNDNIGAQVDTSSRGKGLFFDLYGSGHTASAMTAWTWGVSRIIDVLEITPTAKINVSKIAITGCSRNGKGALMIGAFEPRIALTIPQESGSGGDAAWRLSKYERDQGSDVQDAVEIIGENVWFSANFKNYVSSLNTLPYDHHSLAAMVAPRGLISYENTDYLWLSGLSSWGAMSATHAVYTALGVPDNHGFQQIGGHSHCAWPSSLTGSLNAFFDKFLNDKPTTNTQFFSTNNMFNGKTFTAATWINWSTPTLT